MPYERFKEVNDRLKALETAQAQAEAARKEAADKALADQAQWQKLAEQRETELKAERIKLLRLEVAAVKGLPMSLAGRLQGDDKAAMEKDADTILAQIAEAAKGKLGPGVPPPPQGGRPAATDLSKMTPEEIRKQTSAILNQARS